MWHCRVKLFIMLHRVQDRLPGYVEKLVEFRLLLYTTRGLTSFSAHVAVSVCSLERERERKKGNYTITSLQSGIVLVLLYTLADWLQHNRGS